MGSKLLERTLLGTPAALPRVGGGGMGWAEGEWGGEGNGVNGGQGRGCDSQLPIESGTYNTVKASFWPWLPGQILALAFR